MGFKPYRNIMLNLNREKNMYSIMENNNMCFREHLKSGLRRNESTSGSWQERIGHDDWVKNPFIA